MFRLSNNILLCILVATVFSVDVQAADVAAYAEEVTYESTSKEAIREFQKRISVEDKNYSLLDVEYEILKETPVMNKNEVTKVVTTDVITSGVEFTPEETITENGITYTFENVEEIPTVINGSYEQTVTGFTDYDHAVTNVPQTKVIATTDSRTGETVNATCALTSLGTSGGGWQSNTISITFISYDEEIFIWNGVTVSKSTSAPLQGYEFLLLSSVGENNNSCRVLSTYWTSDTYLNSDGVLCRDAQADVEQYVNYYRANYSGVITAPETTGKVYTITYKGIQTIESDTNTIYTIKATAFYDEIIEEPESNILYYVYGGIALILLIVLVVLIIYMISKKEKKRGNKNASIS